MRRISERELCERDVMYIVPEGTELPEAVSLTLSHFVGVPVVNSVTGERGMRYVIPAYLAREWLAVAGRGMECGQ